MTDGTDTCQSFGDKLHQAFVLANQLTDPDEDIPASYSEELTDLLYAYVDGLEEKRHRKLQSGRCSLQALIDYDVEAEEVRLDEHIALFQKLLAE